MHRPDGLRSIPFRSPAAPTAPARLLGHAPLRSASYRTARLLAARRTVPHSTQLVCNRLAAKVEPHRPPFDHLAHISGQNLFVSAYHGFFTLGNEHFPKPQRFDSFPPFAIKLSDAADDNVTLAIPMSIVLGEEPAAAL